MGTNSRLRSKDREDGMVIFDDEEEFLLFFFSARNRIH